MKMNFNGLAKKLLESKSGDVINKMVKAVKESIDKIFCSEELLMDYRLLYDKVVDIVRRQNGKKLYDVMKKCFEAHAKKMSERLRRLPSTANVFLRQVSVLWLRYRLNIRKSKDILLFLDDSYVEKNTTHDNKILSVYEMGVRIFREHVIVKLGARMTKILLGMIELERNNEAMLDKFLLKNVCTMLVDIDKDGVYRKVFEDPFLKATGKYFARESGKMFRMSSAVDYLKKVMVRLKTEQALCRRCFDPQTLDKLLKVVHHEMIFKYKDLVVKKEGSGVLVMLKNKKEGELELVYKVLSKVPGALQPTILMLKEYIVAEGVEIVKDQKKKCLAMVMEVVDLRRYYETLLRNSFSREISGGRVKDKDFSKAVKEAFIRIVNKNDRFPEYLSLVLDKKLKKGKAQVKEEEADTFFDDIILTFHHVREKDIFEKYYKTHLAKRLLLSRSASDDAEKTFLSKLKTSFGYQFTSKLEGMFKDIKISQEMNQDWKMHRKKMPNRRKRFDLTVQILTHVYWPVTTTTKVQIGQNFLLNETELFTNFYNGKHNGRKLTWQFAMGSADIRANGFGKKYEFNVSTYQMLVILLFNERENEDNDTLTLSQILKETLIPLNELKRNLYALCIPSERGRKPSRLMLRDNKKLENETKFKINKKFKSQKIKIKILPVVKKEDDQQRLRTISKIDEERKWIVDACLVRIMKMRKKIKHKQLILEVIEQLQNRFTTTPDVIKRRIESLIDREYLERDEKDRTVYNYVA